MAFRDLQELQEWKKQLAVMEKEPLLTLWDEAEDGDEKHVIGVYLKERFGIADPEKHLNFAPGSYTTEDPEKDKEVVRNWQEKFSGMPLDDIRDYCDEHGIPYNPRCKAKGLIDAIIRWKSEHPEEEE